MHSHPLMTAVRLADGTIAALDVVRDRWLWLSPDAVHVLDTVLCHGSTVPLAKALTAQGQDEVRVRTALADAAEGLAAAGLLPAPPGTKPLTEAATVAGPPPLAEWVRWRHRLVAAVGLAVAVAVVKVLPLCRLLALLAAVRHLPPATARQAATLHAAVLAARPVWWPGRLACLEVATATTVAAALTGRRVHLVLGARPLPNEAHAWVTTPAGSAVGAYAPDRPWAPVHAVPPLPDNHVNE